MASYHFEAKVISRGTGRSVVAAAAYASCSKIYNDYDGITHDYTRKQGCLYNEIFLPSNAPDNWKNRPELWNAVEAAEKSKDSRLARELVVALPIELNLDNWKNMLEDFISNQCVNKGMCADVSVHNTDGHNPHAHILLTVRPLDDKGRWQAKTQKEYLCKKDGNEQGFTAFEFKSAQLDGWEKQYQYFVGEKKVYMTSSEAEIKGYERASKNPKSTKYGRQNPVCAKWNSEEQIKIWRKAWEVVTNIALEKNNIDERVDCRSFDERGIKEQPTIHEGVTAHIIEKHGIVSERRELNRQIINDNKLIKELKTQIKELDNEIKNFSYNTALTLENIRSKLIVIEYQLLFNYEQINQIDKRNKDTSVLLERYKNILKDIKQKTTKLKQLKAEKNSLTPIHIIKNNQLSKNIAALTEDIEELKTQKQSALDDMFCADDKEVIEVEQCFKNNSDVLEKIKAQNISLKKQKETEISRYTEIKNNILSEDIEAVQQERFAVRKENMQKILNHLQKIYKQKYSYDIFKKADNSVNKNLSEKVIKKSVIKNLIHQNGQKNLSIIQKSKEKNYEQMM